MLLVVPNAACDKTTQTEAQAPAEQDHVDQRTRELLTALTAGDQIRAQELSGPTLGSALDERAVVTLARTLTWLGPITSLEHEPDTPVTGGVERRYEVGFERDRVALTVTVLDEQIAGFEFDPLRWLELSDQALAASVGDLRLAEFDLINLEATDIRYELRLAGLGAALREHHVTVRKRVFDVLGNVVYRQNEDDDIRFPQAEAGSDGGIIEVAVAVPRPGRYVLEMVITDEVETTSMTHRFDFEIE